MKTNYDILLLLLFKLSYKAEGRPLYLDVVTVSVIDNNRLKWIQVVRIKNDSDDGLFLNMARMMTM